MEAEFAAGKKKKAVLWGGVLDSMKAVNPEVKASYKRIKKEEEIYQISFKLLLIKNFHIFLKIIHVLDTIMES